MTIMTIEIWDISTMNIQLNHTSPYLTKISGNLANYGATQGSWCDALRGAEICIAVPGNEAVMPLAAARLRGRGAGQMGMGMGWEGHRFQAW